jgi:hypothetical protein
MNLFTVFAIKFLLLYVGIPHDIEPEKQLTELTEVLLASAC